MQDTTGKVITTENGQIVTDLGPGICNGVIDPVIRNCVTDNGEKILAIARVIRETPETLRRATLPKYIY